MADGRWLCAGTAAGDICGAESGQVLLEKTSVSWVPFTDVLERVMFKPVSMMHNCLHHKVPRYLMDYYELLLSYLTRSLPGQFFPECHPRVWFSFAKVPAGYVLWCRCTAEIHVLNDDRTRQWLLTMHFNWRDNSSVAVNVLINYLSGRQWSFRYLQCGNSVVTSVLRLLKWWDQCTH